MSNNLSFGEHNARPIINPNTLSSEMDSLDEDKEK